MNGPFRYAGVKNGDACYCGNADDKFIPTDPGECNIPCTGDQSQFCGSSWGLQVYDTGFEGDSTKPPTTTLPITTSPTTLDNGSQTFTYPRDIDESVTDNWSASAVESFDFASNNRDYFIHIMNPYVESVS